MGLDGSLRLVRGIIGKLLAGRARGIKHFYIPEANLQQAQLVPGVLLTPVKELAVLCQYLCEMLPLDTVRTGKGIFAAKTDAEYAGNEELLPG